MTITPEQIAAAENAAKKGTGNAALLVHVNAFLADKPNGASNAEIYDGLVSAGVEMAGADPRSNLNSYLARWGTAGALESKGVGVWAAKSVTPAAPPSFLVSDSNGNAAHIDTGPNGTLVTDPDTNAPSFLGTPVEQPVSDTLTEDFPGYEPLKDAGYTTRASLTGATEDSLMQIAGIGKATAGKIVAAFALAV